MGREISANKALLGIAISEMNKSLLRNNSKLSVIKDVIVSGFPYIECDKYELKSLVNAIFDTIKVEILDADIIDIFYLIKKNEDGSMNMSVQSGDQSDDNMRVPKIPFIIKFNNNMSAKKIIVAKRKFKKLIFSNLDKEKHVILKKFEKHDDFVIYINESMSKYYYNLLKKSRDKLKPVGFKKVWQHNGCVYAQFNENLPIHQICSNQDIDKAIEMYVTNP